MKTEQATKPLTAAEAAQRINEVLATCAVIDDRHRNCDERLAYAQSEGKVADSHWFKLRRSRMEVTARLDAHDRWNLKEDDFFESDRGDRCYVMRFRGQVSWPSYGSLPVSAALEHAALLAEAIRVASALEAALAPGVVVVSWTREERGVLERERVRRARALEIELAKSELMSVGSKIVEHKRAGFRGLDQIIPESAPKLAKHLESAESLSVQTERGKRKCEFSATLKSGRIHVSGRVVS